MSKQKSRNKNYRAWVWNEENNISKCFYVFGIKTEGVIAFKSNQSLSNVVLFFKKYNKLMHKINLKCYFETYCKQQT